MKLNKIILLCSLLLVACSTGNNESSNSDFYSESTIESEDNDSSSESLDTSSSEEHIHSYGEYKNYGSNHYKECSCGDKIVEPHTFGDSCTYLNDTYHGYICSKCGATKDEEAHNYGDLISVDDDKHSYTCSDCQHVKLEDHNYLQTDLVYAYYDHGNLVFGYYEFTCSTCEHIKNVPTSKTELEF